MKKLYRAVRERDVSDPENDDAAVVRLYVVEQSGDGEATVLIDPKEARVILRGGVNFEMGVHGTGALLLSIAILLEACRDFAPYPPLIAQEQCRAFLDEFIASAKDHQFEVSQDVLTAWIANRCSEASKGTDRRGKIG